MELDGIYKHGDLVTEPVRCPDDTYIKLRWWDSYDALKIIPGIEVVKAYDPGDFLGTAAWYSLDELELLGRGDLHEGVNKMGQVWHDTSSSDLHTVRPLNDQIKILRGRS